MSVKLKFCGLCRAEDIDDTNEIRPDYAGFVVSYPPSRRSIDEAELRELRSRLSKAIKAVGLFVDAEEDRIISLSDCLDLIQLHGHESAAFCERIRKRTGKPVIKAFVVDESVSLAQIEEFPADYVLLDGGRGEGKQFDYRILHQIKRRYFLAGGLNEKNLSDVLKQTKPFAVDLSSGIETNGVKDIMKMRAIADIVRGEV